MKVIKYGSSNEKSVKDTEGIENKQVTNARQMAQKNKIRFMEVKKSIKMYLKKHKEYFLPRKYLIAIFIWL